MITQYVWGTEYQSFDNAKYQPGSRTYFGNGEWQMNTHEENVVEDLKKVEKVKSVHGKSIDRHNELSQQVIADFGQVLTDLDQLQKVRDLIFAQPKVDAQIITSLLDLDAAHFLPTIRAHVEDARKMFERK